MNESEAHEKAIAFVRCWSRKKFLNFQIKIQRNWRFDEKVGIYEIWLSFVHPNLPDKELNTLLKELEYYDTYIMVSDAGAVEERHYIYQFPWSE